MWSTRLPDFHRTFTEVNNFLQLYNTIVLPWLMWSHAFLGQQFTGSLTQESMVPDMVLSRVDDRREGVTTIKLYLLYHTLMSCKEGTAGIWMQSWRGLSMVAPRLNGIHYSERTVIKEISHFPIARYTLFLTNLLNAYMQISSLHAQEILGGSMRLRESTNRMSGAWGRGMKRYI